MHQENAPTLDGQTADILLREALGMATTYIERAPDHEGHRVVVLAALDVALTRLATPTALRFAKRAREIACTPGRSDQEVHDALWRVTDELLKDEPLSSYLDKGERNG